MSSRSANNSNAIRIRNSINAANGTQKEVIKLPRAQRGRDSACRSTAPAVPWGLLPRTGCAFTFGGWIPPKATWEARDTSPVPQAHGENQGWEDTSTPGSLALRQENAYSSSQGAKMPGTLSPKTEEGPRPNHPHPRWGSDGDILGGSLLLQRTKPQNCT